MNPIERIRDEVQRLVSAELVPQFAGVPYVLLPMPLGKLAQGERSAPPRVAWVPSTGSSAAAEMTRSGPRSIGTLVQRVDLHCWGQNFDHAWQLQESVRRSLHRAASASVQFHSLRWLTQEDAAWLTLGEACLLTVDFKIPLPARPLEPSVTIETIEHTTGLEGSDDNPC